MGGSKSKGEKILCDCISNTLTNIDKSTQNFWKLDSYGKLPKMSPELLPPNEKRLLENLQKTTVIKDNRIENELLWKKYEPALHYNQTLALNRYQSVEIKIAEKSRLDEYIDK